MYGGKQEKGGGQWSEELVLLYREHFGGLVRTAQRVVRSSHVAEELTQDAFLKFVASGVRPRPGREVAYLRSIVMNNARMYLRRAECEDRHRPNDKPVSVQPDDECVRSETRAGIVTALADLPERQRDVVMLRYMHGHSEAEVASRLGITAGSVKTHSSRGRERLRTALATAA